MLKKIFYYVFIAVFILSCDILQDDTKKKTVTIDSLGWLLINETKDDDEDLDDNSVKIVFYIRLAEDDIEGTDISSLEVTSDVGDTSWNIEDFDDRYDGDIITVRLYRSSYPDLMPIGNYTFDITLTNGNSDSYVFNVPAPNSTTIDEFKYIYNEDYISSHSDLSSEYVQLPQRAGNIDGDYNINDETLTIDFSINQSIIYNGTVLLYNDGTYIGYTTYFRDFTTGKVNSLTNSGEDYYVNGESNTINITDSDVTFTESPYSISDITSFIIMLTDGYQYEGNEYSYDSCSYSTEYFLN